MGSTKEKQLIVLIALMLVTCVLVYGVRSTVGHGKKISISKYMESVDGYVAERGVPLTTEIFTALDLDDYMSVAYNGPEGKVGLYIGYYYSLGKVSAAHSPTVCFPGQGWNITQPSMRSLVVGDKTIHYAEMVASILERKTLVLFWYQAYHLTTPYVYKNKINTLINKFSGDKEDHAFVRVSIPITDNNQEKAERAGVEFIRAFYPKFIRFIDENDIPPLIGNPGDLKS